MGKRVNVYPSPRWKTGGRYLRAAAIGTGIALGLVGLGALAPVFIPFMLDLLAIWALTHLMLCMSAVAHERAAEGLLFALVGLLFVSGVLVLVMSLRFGALPTPWLL